MTHLQSIKPTKQRMGSFFQTVIKNVATPKQLKRIKNMADLAETNPENLFREVAVNAFRQSSFAKNNILTNASADYLFNASENLITEKIDVNLDDVMNKLGYP